MKSQNFVIVQQISDFITYYKHSIYISRFYCSLTDGQISASVDAALQDALTDDTRLGKTARLKTSRSSWSSLSSHDLKCRCGKYAAVYSRLPPMVSQVLLSRLILCCKALEGKLKRKVWYTADYLLCSESVVMMTILWSTGSTSHRLQYHFCAVAYYVLSSQIYTSAQRQQMRYNVVCVM